MFGIATILLASAAAVAVLLLVGCRKNRDCGPAKE